MDDSNFRETDSIPSEDVAIRLPIEFDPAKLIKDLEAVKHVDLAPQPGPYHDGAWKGISLHSQGGKQSAHPGYAGLDGFYPTDALKHTPYMKEILDGLRCPKKVVRLLTLPPGVEIGEHNDAWANFYCGTLRLHIPIITHPDVEFVINDRRCVWKPGEFWYGDFSLPLGQERQLHHPHPHGDRRGDHRLGADAVPEGVHRAGRSRRATASRSIAIPSPPRRPSWRRSSATSGCRPK